MTRLNEIYKCEICGNIVEMVHSGQGTLVCCGENMKLLEEKTKDLGNEKHVPIIEKNKEEVIIKVGKIEHPMQETHYIEFIEILTENKVLRKYLESGEKPEAKFNINSEIKKVRIFCNLHGLWKNEK